MTRVAIIGYASLDHVIELEGAPAADRTAFIRARPEGWGRLGGCPSYVARALAAEGVGGIALISWVGADKAGQSYRDALAREGLSVDGVEARDGRTPIAILAYQPEGGCMCLYDPGLSLQADLSAPQRALIEASDWLCVTIGPPQATRDALAAARAGTRVLWAVKNDPRSMPAELVSLMAARADIICHADGESEFVAAALRAARARDRLVVATHGAAGAAVNWRGQSHFAPADRVSCADPTGAGDTFIGGLIAGLIDFPEDPVAAVERGAAAARRMLVERETAYARSPS
jgi:ribokinase